MKNLKIIYILFLLTGALSAQTTLITDGTWKGVGNSSAAGGTAWLFPGYDDSAWPGVEAPNAANVIPVVPGSLSIWVLPYSDTAKMRKTFIVPVGDTYSGSISINADNEFELFFNGVSQGFYNDWMGGPYVFNISPVLQGCVQNVIAINGANWGGPYGASLSTTLTVGNPLNTPVAYEETNVSCTSFTANWDSVPTADFYMLDVSTDPLFGSFYSVYHDYNVGTNLSQILSSLPPGVNYYYRLRCQRTNGLGTLISCYSNVITVDLSDPVISYTAPDSLCAGSTITLQLTAPGSTLGWIGPAGFTSTDSVSYITNTTALNTGNYIYAVSYPGCPVISDTIYIEVIDNTPLVVSNSGPYCSTGNMDTLLSSYSGVQWTGIGIVSSSLGTFDPSVSGSGTFNITCVVPGFCPDTAVTTVIVNANGAYTISGSDTLCNGQNISLQSTTGSGAVFSWSGPNSYTSSNNNNTITQAGIINSGNYIFTVSYPSCPTVQDTLTVTVINYQDPVITPFGPFCNTDPAINLPASPSGGIWAGVGITDPVTGNFDPAVAGNGIHSVIYGFGGYCPSADTINITVATSVPLSSVKFPNIFTPNNDGNNELYAPQVPSGGHYKLVIFDRWGVVVFSAEQDVAWNGVIGSSPATEGVYYWICEITSDCSKTPLTEKGFLQIFKP
jgi:gliding motility-associated-like protein